MFLSLCLVTVAGLGVYGFTIYNQSTDVLSKTYKSFGKDTDVIAATKWEWIPVVVHDQIRGLEIVTP